MKRSLIFLLGVCVSVAAATGVILAKRNLPGEKGQASSPAVPGQTLSSNLDFGKVPIFFVPNQGQVDGRVRFYVQGKDKTIYFTPAGVTFALNYPDKPQDKEKTRSLFEHHPLDRGEKVEKDLKRWVVKMDFEGARKNLAPEGVDKTGAVISYFKGKPEEWRTGLPAYSKIIYRNLWHRVDLVYKGEMDRLKYEFVVHPGGDPEAVRLKLRGAEKVWIGEAGELKISTPGGSFKDEAPVAYQQRGENRVEVPIAYKLRAEPQSEALDHGSQEKADYFAFKVGPYDKTKDLVLDPATLVYCGYIGGNAGEQARAIAVDKSGNAYITGYTFSDQSTFPEKVGPYLTFNGVWDAFVAKVNASGTGLVYCGYIGGDYNDEGFAIAVDGSGNAYITGYTMSDQNTFPAKVGPDLTHTHGTYDAFVAKVNPYGTNLYYCGYIGGDHNDEGFAIAVDESGNAYITGITQSDQNTFPVKVGPDLTFNGVGDAFVAKVNASGTDLVYCGYIGGENNDNGLGITVYAKEKLAYITGQTQSDQNTFPVKVGPDLTFNGGDNDAFVAMVNSGGTALNYCGYIGGNGSDAGTDIAVDKSGNAYITGYTYSDQGSFPEKVGPDLTYNGNGDAFVAKVHPSGINLVYCGYIGGGWLESGHGIAVDGSGNAYVAGHTSSDENTFPVKGGPDLTFNGVGDAFVAKVNPYGTNLYYCGYIGGDYNDEGFAIAVDESGNAYVTGFTQSSQSSFPEKVGPDLTFNGATDAFVAKIYSYVNLNAPVLDLPINGSAGNVLSVHLIWGDTNSDPQEVAYKIRIKKSGGSYNYYETARDETNYLPLGLMPNITYYWNVQAKGNGKDTKDSPWANSGADWSFKTVPKVILRSPILTSPGNGFSGRYTTLELACQDTNQYPEELSSKFRIKPAGGSYTYYIDKSAYHNPITHLMTKLAPNKTYYWNVQAVGNGTTLISSPWANSEIDWWFTTSPAITLLAPVPPVSPANGSTGAPFDLYLIWTDPNALPAEIMQWVQYKVRFKPAGGLYTYGKSTWLSRSLWKAGLAPNKTYFWNVQAIGDGTGVLNSAWANGGADWSFTTSPPVTLNPPGLIAPADGATDQLKSVTLQWTDPNDTFPENGYQIRIKPSGGVYTLVTTAKNVTSYLKTGLALNKTYYWNVRAKGNGTTKKDSPWANAGVDWHFTTMQ